MKLIALHDESGKILAAARFTDDYKGPVPAAGEGTSVVEVDVPQAHAKLDLAAICTRLRVDTRTSKLVEHKAESAR
jgi:hypothetical protein